MSERVVCRNCGQSKTKYAKGICWHCFRRLGLGAQCESVSKYGRRGVGLGNTSDRLPEPTRETPGTPGKLEVLAARAARGESLFHPDDPTGPMPRRGVGERLGKPVYRVFRGQHRKSNRVNVREILEAA